MKQGMVFPFTEFMDRCVLAVVVSARMFGTCLLKLSLFRFQGQSQLYKSKASEFQSAIEEATLAENGILDSHLEAKQIMEGADSHVDQVILYLLLCVAYNRG